MSDKKIFGFEYSDFELIISEELLKEITRCVFYSNEFTADNASEYLEKISDFSSQALIEQIRLRNFHIALTKQALRKVNASKLNEFVNFNKIKINKWSKMIGKPTVKEISDLNEFYRVDDWSNEYEEEATKEGVVTKPEDIKKQIDKVVIGQEKAKTALSYTMYLHLIRNKIILPKIYESSSEKRLPDNLQLPRPNIILVGPTGSGKTYILKTLCSLYDIPFIKVDCASLVSSGYVGNKLSDYLWILYDKCDNIINKMEKAIIYFDEFDKLSGLATRADSVGSTELQQEFLNFLEDEVIHVPPRRTMVDSFPISLLTSNLMFVFSGSFYGIEKIIQKRLEKDEDNLFIDKDKKKKGQINYYEYLNYNDIIEFGIIPELVGRVNNIISLNPMDKDMVISILKDSEASPLKSYINYFWLHHDELIIEEEVYDLIAEKVVEANSGARGINAILHELLKEALYSSPNMRIERIYIDKNYFNKVFNIIENEK